MNNQVRPTVNNIYIRCTGCSACMSICPVSAIDMKKDNFGFLKPVINDKCISCSRCVKVCPDLNPKYLNTPTPTVYGVSSTSEKIIDESSSGGAFYFIAKKCLAQEGVVYGVAWDNEQMLAYHKRINSYESLKEIQYSKYTQSDVKNSFTQVQSDLKQGLFVVFSGTPCQIAGLYNFLGVSYENLITVEVLCHGVPSPTILHQDIQSYGDCVKGVQFRSIKKQRSLLLIHRDGKPPVEDKSFMRKFLGDLILNECCYSCKFNRLPRQADITIGDFWSKRHYPSLPTVRKLGLVLLNNNKGKEYFLSAKTNETVISEVAFDNKLNPNVYRINLKRGWGDAKIFMENSINKIYDIGLSLWLSNNYGSILTNWALYRWNILRGKSVCVLEDKSHLESKGRKVFEYFKIPLEDSKKITLDTAVVGSDITWVCVKNGLKYLEKFLLKGVHCKQKVSVASSAQFHEKLNTVIDGFKSELPNFSLVTVREKSGKEMIENLYNREAFHVLDPVFYLPREEYDNFINHHSHIEPLLKKTNYVFVYFLSPSDIKINFVKKVCKERNLEYIIIYNYSGNKPCDVSEGLQGLFNTKDIRASIWLCMLKYARMVITDSFHGCAMSVIYEKNFLGINDRLWPYRLKSFREMMGLEKNIVDKTPQSTYIPDVNYQEVKKLLDEKVKETMNILSKHL